MEVLREKEASTRRVQEERRHVQDRVERRAGQTELGRRASIARPIGSPSGNRDCAQPTRRRARVVQRPPPVAAPRLPDQVGAIHLERRGKRHGEVPTSIANVPRQSPSSRAREEHRCSKLKKCHASREGTMDQERTTVNGSSRFSRNPEPSVEKILRPFLAEAREV